MGNIFYISFKIFIYLFVQGEGVVACIRGLTVGTFKPILSFINFVPSTKLGKGMLAVVKEKYTNETMTQRILMIKNTVTRKARTNLV